MDIKKISWYAKTFKEGKKYSYHNYGSKFGSLLNLIIKYNL